MDLTSSDDSDCDQWAAGSGCESTDDTHDSCQDPFHQRVPELANAPDFLRFSQQESARFSGENWPEQERAAWLSLGGSDVLKDWRCFFRAFHTKIQARRHLEECWEPQTRLERASVEDFKRELLEELKTQAEALETQLIQRTNRLQEIIKKYAQ